MAALTARSLSSGGKKFILSSVVYSLFDPDRLNYLPRVAKDIIDQKDAVGHDLTTINKLKQLAPFWIRDVWEFWKRLPEDDLLRQKVPKTTGAAVRARRKQSAGVQ